MMYKIYFKVIFMEGLQADDLFYDFLTGADACGFVNNRVDDFDECVIGFEVALREMLDSIDDCPEDFYIAVALHGDQIVAFRYGVVQSSYAQSGWSVVAPNLRGAGIASRLHDTMVEGLSDLGVEEVRSEAITPLGEAFLRDQEYEDLGDNWFGLAI